MALDAAPSIGDGACRRVERMMVDPTDPRELIDEALDRAEARQDRQDAVELAVEKRFRDRVSILVGVFAVLLAVIHVAAAGNQRDSILQNISASDDFSYMQAKIIRETILKTAIQTSDLDPDAQAKMRNEAARLRNPDKAGHGIGQLQKAGERAREESAQSSKKSELYELGETALQVAIVLLSLALVARSWAITIGASALAGFGVLVALATALRLI
jgi:hypothetical protein